MTVDEVLCQAIRYLEEAAHRAVCSRRGRRRRRPDAPPRLSVELRLMALFEEETDKLARIKRFHAELPPASMGPR